MRRFFVLVLSVILSSNLALAQATRQVTLPNTKVTLRVPLMTYYMAVSGYKTGSRGIIPDHAVQYSVAELIAGTDKEMEVAVRLARG
jgi:hypothetical protein